MKFNNMYPSIPVGAETPVGTDPVMFHSPIPYYCEGCYHLTNWFDPVNLIRCCSTKCRDKIMKSKGIKEDTTIISKSSANEKEKRMTDYVKDDNQPLDAGGLPPIETERVEDQKDRLLEAAKEVVEKRNTRDIYMAIDKLKVVLEAVKEE